MRVYYTRAFREDYAALPDDVRAQADKHLEFFITNPRHPSLHVKKIRGTTRSVWEGRVSQGYRFTFEWEGDRVILRRIGPHEILDREARRRPWCAPTGELGVRSK